MKMTHEELINKYNAAEVPVKATIDSTNVCFKRFNGMECEVCGYTDDKTPKFIVLLNGKEYELRAKDLDVINIEETPKKNIKVSVAKAKDGKEYARIWAPYSEDFIFGIKHIEGAKWLDRIKAWSIPAKSLEYAREIMRICYGKDDRQVA